MFPRTVFVTSSTLRFDSQKENIYSSLYFCFLQTRCGVVDFCKKMHAYHAVPLCICKQLELCYKWAILYPNSEMANRVSRGSFVRSSLFVQFIQRPRTKILNFPSHWLLLLFIRIGEMQKFIKQILFSLPALPLCSPSSNRPQYSVDSTPILDLSFIRADLHE